MISNPNIIDFITSLNKYLPILISFVVFLFLILLYLLINYKTTFKKNPNSNIINKMRYSILFLLFRVPREMKPLLKEDAKKAGLSKRAFTVDLLFFYYKDRIIKKRRTDYYDKWNRQ